MGFQLPGPPNDVLNRRAFSLAELQLRRLGRSDGMHSASSFKTLTADVTWILAMKKFINFQKNPDEWNWEEIQDDIRICKELLRHAEHFLY